MIRVVFFDAGGVLHTSNTEQATDLKQELGLTDDQLSVIYSEYLPLLGKGLITEDELWVSAHKRFGIRLVKPHEKLFTRTFETSLKKMTGMYELVESLKSLGLKVALLTNVSPQYAEVLEKAGHYQPFDTRILSFEVGAWKPEQQIFKIALDTLEVQPEESLFIDDTDVNVQAAKKLGLHGIVFKNTKQLKLELRKYIPFLE